MKYLEMSQFFYLNEKGLWRRGYVTKQNKTLKDQLVRSKVNSGCGYCCISFKGKRIKYHRIVWVLYNKCDIPDGFMIDHKNGDKVDNRPENLRLVTARENTQNTYKHRQGRLPGCRLHEPTGKYQARATIDGVKLHLGLFNTEQEAYAAYLDALKQVVGSQYEK